MSNQPTIEFSRKLSHWQRGVVRRMARERAVAAGGAASWGSDANFTSFYGDIGVIAAVVRAPRPKVNRLVYDLLMSGELQAAVKAVAPWLDGSTVVAQPGPRSRVARDLAR